MVATQTRGIWALMVVRSPFSIVLLRSVTSRQRVSSFEVAVKSTGNVHAAELLLYLFNKRGRCH